MRTRLSIVTVVALAVATAIAQDGQTPAAPQPSEAQPVFRAGTNFVRVDMYATRDGELVPDLRQDEVELFEDGVRQRIETFEYVQVAGSAAGGELPTASETARSRVYVVFIDTFTTALDREPVLRLSLVRFLDRLLTPTDLVALVTPDMPIHEVALRRRDTVISDLANDPRWIRPDAPERENLQEFAWENCYPSRGGPSRRLAEMRARQHARTTIQALQDLMGHLRDLREERKAVLFVTAGWPFMSDSVLQNTTRGAESDACAADRAALLKLDYNDLLRELARSANRANVSFYPVNTRRVLAASEVEPSFRNGVPVNPAMVVQRDRQLFELTHRVLRTLAEDTDGRAEAGVNSLEQLTDRVIADTSSYYLIGYQSTNTKVDGRFRSIAVRIQRDGVRVRARAGYGGSAPPPPIEVEAPVSRGPVVDSRVALAIDTVGRFDTAAPLWLRAAAWNGGDEGRGGAFWFIGEVGAVRGQRPWASGVSANLEVLRADRAGVLSRVFDLPAGDTTFSLRVPESGYLPPGDYLVRVRLTPQGEGSNSVSDSIRVRIDADTAGSGAAVVWRRGPSPRLEFLQTADPRFRRNERLRLELPTDSQAGPTARMLDRLGQPLQVPVQLTERADASGEFEWLVVEAPLTALAPGDYAIEVMQDGAPQVTAFRIVP